MKVLYFMNHVGKGGAALALLDLIREIKHNHKYIKPVVITGCYNELNQELNNIGVENYSAPFKNFLTTYRRPTWVWKVLFMIRYWITKKKSVKRIEKVIDFKRIDLIHSNLNRIDIGYYFSKKYNIPHIWHIREHGTYDFKLMQVFPGYNPIKNDTFSNFIVISESVKKAWENKLSPKSDIHLVYDGINEASLLNAPQLSKFEKLSFVFVGGLYINKGQEYFIKALGNLPQNIRKDIIVHFYGEGSEKYKQKLQALLKTMGLDGQCYIFDYDKNIYNKLRKYHVGVNCSKLEGFGRITVEYMIAGLCPLVSNTGANVEIVNDGFNGLLFDRNNIQDICDNIVKLYENRDLIESYSLRAQRDAIEKFSMKAHANNICYLYNSVIA